MQIDWWTLGLQAVNALVLVWLLAHFLFRPVVDAIAAAKMLISWIALSMMSLTFCWGW